MDNINNNVIPFDRLVDSQDNVYELTSASIRRAEQITVTKNEELKREKIKIVSEALREILEGDVKYSYKD
jgi:DNA-directed RNA polymerase subunit omega